MIDKLLNITPEDYYFKTIRPAMQKIIYNISYDEILVITVEEIMNKADISAKDKKYSELTEDFFTLFERLIRTGDSYFKDLKFIRAEQEEKKTVKDFTKQLIDFHLILSSTKEMLNLEEEDATRERLNYNKALKSNNNSDDLLEEKLSFKRLPNK